MMVGSCQITGFDIVLCEKQLEVGIQPQVYDLTIGGLVFDV